MKNLNILVQDTKDVLDDLGIVYGPIVKVTVNNRAKSRWGRCKKVGSTYEIEISGDLMGDDTEWEAAMNTMIHEFLHAHKDRMCHTGEWKRCAELVNRAYPIYNIKRVSSAEERGIVRDDSEYKYKITCDTCGSASYYKRKTKVVTKLMMYPNRATCMCNICKGKKFTVKEI